MRAAICAGAIAIVLNIGAQKITPKATPSTTAKGGSVRQLNSTQEADSAEQTKTAKPQIAPCTQASPCYIVEEPQGKTEEQKAQDASLDRLYRRYMWATIFGVFGAFIGLGILIWQTRISRKAANAALLNAQAVLDSERPWLVVTVEKNEALPGRYYFFFRVTNKGRTPASFVSGGFSQTFRFAPNKLPIPPDYKPCLVPNNVFLAPEGYFDVYRTEDERIMGISPQAMMKGRPPTEILFFYGNIIYDDVLGKNRPGYGFHETRWCFAFFLDGMRFVRTGPDGSDEYNRQT